MVTAIVVKDGNDYVPYEMFVLGEGLKTTQEMKKYRHVNYQPSLYYDKQSGGVVDLDANLAQKRDKEILHTQLREKVLHPNPIIRALRRGR